MIRIHVAANHTATSDCFDRVSGLNPKQSVNSISLQSAYTLSVHINFILKQTYLDKCYMFPAYASMRLTVKYSVAANLSYFHPYLTETLDTLTLDPHKSQL